MDVVLLELGTRATPALQVIERVAARGAANRPIIVIVPNTRLGYRQLLKLLLMELEIRIVLKTLAAESLFEAAALGSATHRRRCVDQLSSMLATRLDEASSSVLLPVLTVGCRRSRMSELERASGMPGRTLRARLTRLGLPRPSRLLAHVVGCNVAFHCEQDEPKLSVVAQRLGFNSADELRKHLVRHTALTPSEWRALGFSASVQRLVECLFSKESIGNSAENVLTAAKRVLATVSQ